MRFVPLLCLLALAACTVQDQARPEAAQPAWVELQRDRNMAFFMDTARVTQGARGIWTVWLRFDHAEPQPVPSDPSKTFHVVEVREVLDCPNQRATDLAMRVLDKSATRVVGEPDFHSLERSFSEHPLGAVFPLSCALAEAKRQGRLSAAIRSLPKVPR